MEQLILHLIGDYVTQSQWMADNKRKSWRAAAIHALVYAAPFALICSWWAVDIIFVTHLLIDRFGLARYLVYAKNNWLTSKPFQLSWADCSATGYPSAVPPFLAVWLLIIADNTLHLSINYLAIRYLG
jgi:Protein of unknown function (DUF3307)